jgi:hypothetical protein
LNKKSVFFVCHIQEKVYLWGYKTLQSNGYEKSGNKKNVSQEKTDVFLKEVKEKRKALWKKYSKYFVKNGIHIRANG